MRRLREDLKKIQVLLFQLPKDKIRDSIISDINKCQNTVEFNLLYVKE